jgi:hypothetical protein
MKHGISEFVAEGRATGDNTEVRVYRALRTLLCTRCGKEIEVGSQFTRKLMQGIYLTPQCERCVPFTLKPPRKGKKEELLDSLLNLSESIKAQPAKSITKSPSPEAREAADKRLGPALSRRKN